ncbi:acid phosphatase [Amycolatopsis magusensis]|uniref:Phosphoglycerate mutase n=1 Tax=Amycolatopsis magusensis TaxID=882444 RepID=A0ABS4PGZ3_9PSEU|nr:acid phosphatase [Amycolatopsis magusensis]MBP2178660.1 putative phosphoglycerate mutase [Amycolatopsis magusensis]
MAHPLFLLRHGQTEWSAQGKHTGRTDLPLTDTGREQARSAGRTLAGRLPEGTPAVLSSPRQRALKTAELAGLTVSEITEELAEWDYGDYEGITTEEIRETVPGWTVWSHPVPNGETAEQVSARADRVLTRIRELLADRPVVLVGHGHFSRVLVARWLDLAATDGVRFALEAAGLTELGDERGVPQLRHLNIPPQ